MVEINKLYNDRNALTSPKSQLNSSSLDIKIANLNKYCFNKFIEDNKSIYGTELSRDIIGKVRMFTSKSLKPDRYYIGICLGFYNDSYGTEYFDLLYLNKEGIYYNIAQEVELEKKNFMVKNIHFKTPELRDTFVKVKELLDDIQFENSVHYDEEDYRYTIGAKRKKLEELKSKLFKLYENEMLERNK